MALVDVDIGAVPNDGTGDSLRTAFGKVNGNFAALADLDTYIVTGSSLLLVGDDSTSNTAPLQDALDAMTSGGEIWILSPGIYRSGALTIPNDNISIRLAKGVTLKFPTLGTNTPAISVEANYFTIYGGGKLQGPSSAAYVLGEHCIDMIGTSSASRKTGLCVRGVEIMNFGSIGVQAKWTDNIEVDGGCYIHDCGYAGAMFTSCNNGRFVGNTIDNITPGTSSNMYGVSLTHDTAGYSSDANAGTKLAANPFCRGWNIAFNEISRVAWEGIDAHGAYEVQVAYNRIYATQQGIAITESSGNADDYAGYSNIIVGNIVDARNKDGSTSGYENDSYGININGGATVTQMRIVCNGNIVVYKGLKLNSNVGAIQATRATRLVISANVIDNWSGVGILLTLAGGQISDNFFGQLAASGDTNSSCILDSGPSTRKLVVDGNTLDVEGGIAPANGFRQIAAATVRPTLSGNRFSDATTPFNLSTGGFSLGTDVVPRLAVAGAAGAIDIAALGGEDGVVALTDNDTYTVTNFTNGSEGQTITVMKSGTGTVTVDRTNAALDGGTNKTLTGAYTLTLRQHTGVWRQIAYSQGS
jgi:hypothetical protein